jgi:hypothetical protein
MSSVLQFEQTALGELWTPTTAVLTNYTQIIDENSFTTETDDGAFYRGLYTDVANPVRRVTLDLTMQSDDMVSLLEFREAVRIQYFDAYLGRIDPFLDNTYDATHMVRMIDFGRPTKNRREQYSVQIGLVK